MKKYQDHNHNINESTSEENLLQNLFDLHLKKYNDRPISFIEKEFIEKVFSLIERGEVDRRSARKFLDDMGIEGEIPERRISQDSCGGGGGGRSYC